MKLIEKKNYYKKKLKKKNYIKTIYKNYHNTLFEYSDLIPHTDIKKIEITDQELSFFLRNHGVKIYIPRHDNRSAPLECLNFGTYEKKELQAILQIIPKNGNFLDIGANIGWYSLITAKLYKKLRVYSFEPIKKTYNFLLKNIACNFLKNIRAYNFGFYNKNKQIIFYTYKEGSGNSSIRNVSDRKNIELQKCKVKVLDDFISNYNIKVDFIKCDVEGAELFVLLGAKKTLIKYKPIILCEILRKWCKKFQYNPNEIILLLKKFGYKCYYIFNFNNSKILNTSNKALNKLRLKEIKKITNKTKETNFIFIHKVKHKKIINKFN
jgi:FkbM family methyltransferase